MKPLTVFRLGLILPALLTGCATEDIRLSDAAYREMSKGNYAQAETYLNQALALNPNNPYALLNRGAVYQNTGRLDEARADYDRLMALDPDERAGSDTTESLGGTPLADIAGDNLRLLRQKKNERARARRARSVPSEPESTEAVAQIHAGRQRYTVVGGDTLYSVAGRQDVYGDPLKWPTLFRHNLDNLDFLKVEPNLPHRRLAEGLSLEVVTPEQARESLKELAPPLWTINVSSFRVRTNAVLPAVQLMKRGYHVYTPEVRVAGQEWVRLRVGFFADHSEAERAGNEIMAALEIPERPWLAQATPEELKRFAAF